MFHYNILKEKFLKSSLDKTKFCFTHQYLGKITKQIIFKNNLQNINFLTIHQNINDSLMIILIIYYVILS